MKLKERSIELSELETKDSNTEISELETEDSLIENSELETENSNIVISELETEDSDIEISELKTEDSHSTNKGIGIRYYWAIIFIISLITGATYSPEVQSNHLALLSFIFVGSFLYWLLSFVAYKYEGKFKSLLILTGLVVCMISIGTISVNNTKYMLVTPSKDDLIIYLVYVLFVAVGLGFGFIRIRRLNDNMEISKMQMFIQTLMQTLIYVIFFCIATPLIYVNVVLTNDELIKSLHLEGLKDIIIILNTLAAGVIAVMVQQYKNVHHYSTRSVWFGNFVQDFTAITIVLSSVSLYSELLDLMKFNLYLLGITLVAYYIRSASETKFELILYTVHKIKYHTINKLKFFTSNKIRYFKRN